MDFLFCFLGGPEVWIILAVILLLFGANKIPQLAKGLGKSVGEYKKAKSEYDSAEVKEKSSTDHQS